MHSATETGSQELTIRLASKQFGVPKSTLQARLAGKSEPGKRPGDPTKHLAQQEGKLMDYAFNCAALGLGFGRTQFLRYAEKFA